MIFKYEGELCASGEIIYRPVADILLKTIDGKWVEFHPYIDSGADCILIPYSLGKLIFSEKNNEKKESLGGISGGVDVIYLQCEVKIGDCIFNAKVAWAQIEDVPSLLGRTDIFDNFNIEFKQKDKEIIFKKYKKKKSLIDLKGSIKKLLKFSDKKADKLILKAAKKRYAQKIANP